VVVLARELNMEQVSEIYQAIVRDNIRGRSGELIRIEMFCHGALCMAVSGKCYLSLHEKNISANRGACNQICRRGYVVKDKDSEIELEIDNEYIMSPKDLKTIGFIDEMMRAGVRVFKIEGRADGVIIDPDTHEILVDEIKTSEPDFADLTKDALTRYWSQAKFYAWLLAERESVDQVTVQLTYFQTTTELVTQKQEDKHR
jgi:collagenase-like PrtC family protease